MQLFEIPPGLNLSRIRSKLKQTRNRLKEDTKLGKSWLKSWWQLYGRYQQKLCSVYFNILLNIFSAVCSNYVKIRLKYLNQDQNVAEVDPGFSYIKHNQWLAICKKIWFQQMPDQLVYHLITQPCSKLLLKQLQLCSTSLRSHLFIDIFQIIKHWSLVSPLCWNVFISHSHSSIFEV